MKTLDVILVTLQRKIGITRTTNLGPSPRYVLFPSARCCIFPNRNKVSLLPSSSTAGAPTIAIVLLSIRSLACVSGVLVSISLSPLPRQRLLYQGEHFLTLATLNGMSGRY